MYSYTFISIGPLSGEGSIALVSIWPISSIVLSCEWHTAVSYFVLL